MAFRKYLCRSVQTARLYSAHYFHHAMWMLRWKWVISADDMEHAGLTAQEAWKIGYSARELSLAGYDLGTVNLLDPQIVESDEPEELLAAIEGCW